MGREKESGVKCRSRRGSSLDWYLVSSLQLGESTVRELLSTGGVIQVEQLSLIGPVIVIMN